MVKNNSIVFILNCFIKYLLNKNKFDDDMVALILNINITDFGMNIVQLMAEECHIQ